MIELIEGRIRTNIKLIIDILLNKCMFGRVEKSEYQFVKRKKTGNDGVFR